MKIFNRGKNILVYIRDQLSPSDAAWRGARRGLQLVAVLMLLALLLTIVLPNFTWQKLLGITVIIAVLLLFGAFVALVIKLLGKLPALFRRTLFIITPMVLLLQMPAGGKGAALLVIALLVSFGLGGAALAVLKHDGLKPRIQKVTIASLLGSILILAVGFNLLRGPAESENPALDDYQLVDQTLDLPNPGLPGDYKVLQFTYGSGADLLRVRQVHVA